MTIFSKFLTISTLFCAFSFTSMAADETATFKVHGNAACEATIESLVSGIEGVTSAHWDAATQLITVVFNNELVKKHSLYVALAEGGYDNEELNAKKAKYDALPAACKYERAPEED